MIGVSVLSSCDFLLFSELEDGKGARLEFAGWLPAWAGDAGYLSVLENREILTTVSPVWYQVNESGEIRFVGPGNHQRIVDSLQDMDIGILPSVPLFDHELFTTIVTDSMRFERHVAGLIDIGLDPAHDGIDLNYESIKLTDRSAYYELLKRVAASLQAERKTVSVTVLAEWSDSSDVYPSLKETHEVIDYAKIAAVADELRIMAYDFTSAYMQSPGPIGPLTWQRQVLNYAIAKGVPRGKIVLGVHLYGYEWHVVVRGESGDGKEERLSFTPDFRDNSITDVRVRTYDYRLVKKALSIVSRSATSKQTAYQGEQILRYTRVYEGGRPTEERVLVFVDQEGLQARADLARELGIKGMAFWRLGRTDELLELLPKNPKVSRGKVVSWRKELAGFLIGF